MKTLIYRFFVATGAAFLFLPLLTFAQPSPGAAEAADFVDRFNTVILFPTIALLSAVAFFVFLWGTAQYFFNAANEQGREQGVKHITWGIIGLVIMLSAFTNLSIAASTFGLSKEVDCAKDPTDAGCAGVFSLP
jgi:hypothetical protein